MFLFLRKYPELKVNKNSIDKSIMNPPELSVLKFANDCTISLKQIKIRSFNLFHRCQMACVRDLKNQQSEQCFKSCEHGSFKFNEYFVINFRFDQTWTSFINSKDWIKLKIQAMFFIIWHHLPLNLHLIRICLSLLIRLGNSNFQIEICFLWDNNIFSHHKCLETEVKLKDYIKKLQEYLDDMSLKYSKK